MTDAEILQHVADLGRLIERAHAEGDIAAARAWAAAMADAKKGMSPEWIAAREAELGLGPSCYFHDQGEADRAAAGVRS